MTVVLIVVLAVLLGGAGVFVFSRELDLLSRKFFMEKVDRLVSLAYEQDELFFEGVYEDDISGRKRVIDKIRIIFRQEKNLETFPFVVDDDGKVVIHPEHEEGMAMFTGSALSFLKGHDEGDFEETHDKIRRWYVFKKYRPWHWTFCMTMTVEQRDATVRAFVRTVAGISLFMILIAIVSALWFSRVFLRPLGRVVRRLEKIADGEISLANIPDSDAGSDEIGTLILAFNVMTDKLSETMGGLQEARDRLEQRVKERTEQLAAEVEERKRSEESLRRNEQFLSDVFSGIQDGIMVLDREMNVVRVNDTMEQWYPGIRTSGKKCHEVCRQQVEVCHNCPAIKTLQSGKMDRATFPRMDPNGKQVGWIESFSFPLVSPDSGEIYGVIEHIRDITQRKQAEEDLQKAYEALKAAQSQLVQSEKMASLGMLSAGVAHEINNPLGFIISNLSMLKVYLKAYNKTIETADILIKTMSAQTAEQTLKRIDEFYEMQRDEHMADIIKDIDPLLNQTLEGLDRVKKIVSDLKTFAHADTGMLLKADIHKIMDNAIHICWNEIKYKIELKKEYGQIPLVDCNEQKLEQVFINILINAVQAIEGQGTVRISTCVRGGKVCVQIADSGKGISPEHIDKIFDPFFTTKVVGKGTGLGLSVSYDIIKQHGGDILAESVPGRGTTFTILLPDGTSV